MIEHPGAREIAEPIGVVLGTGHKRRAPGLERGADPVGPDGLLRVAVAGGEQHRVERVVEPTARRRPGRPAPSAEVRMTQTVSSPRPSVSSRSAGPAAVTSGLSRFGSRTNCRSTRSAWTCSALERRHETEICSLTTLLGSSSSRNRSRARRTSSAPSRCMQVRPRPLRSSVPRPSTVIVEGTRQECDACLTLTHARRGPAVSRHSTARRQ